MIAPSQGAALRSFIPDETKGLLNFLERNGLGDVSSFLESTRVPGDFFFFRVNTVLRQPEDILNDLRKEYEEWEFMQDSFIPEAIAVRVKGGNIPVRQSRTVLLDKYAAEAVLMSAPLYAPGLQAVINRFKMGDLVTMIHRRSISGREDPIEYTCANGVALIDSSNASKIKHGVVVRTTDAPFISPSIQKWPAFERGEIIGQTYPSMVVSRVLDPEKGELILDACAGKGGKTTHVAQLIQDQGTIIAVDRSKRKTARLEEIKRKMRMSCINVVHSRIENLETLPTGAKPDKILIDPPCSALGLRPKLYTPLSVKDIKSLAANQARIFSSVMKHVRPGTQIVYSTCTVTLEENEILISKMMEQHGLKLLKPSLAAGHPGIQIDTFSRDDSKKLVRFFPHVDDVTGFFIAKLEKE
ncbi:MAG: methyltransferase domain-containing protein [Promethearchaeota archaeon]